MLERHLGSLAEDAPFLSQKIRDRALPILDPYAPLPARLLDRLEPVRQASQRPLHTARRGQNETIRLCVLEDNVHQGEQIRGPFEEFVSKRATAQGTPRRRWRRLLCS
jgi:hypothetical protein